MKELDIKSTTDKKGQKVNLIKVNNGKAVQLFLYEDQELPSSSYAYEWIGKIDDVGTVGYYKGERKILLQLSDIYCGYPLKVNLSLTEKNWLYNLNINSISYTSNKKLPIYEHPKQAERTFVIECPIKINKVDFLDYLYEPIKENSSVYENEAQGFIYCDVEGLNTKKIKYQLLYNDEVETESVAEIKLNQVYIPFKIPDSAYKKGEVTKVKIALRFIDFEEYNKLHSMLKTAFNNIFTGYLNVIGYTTNYDIIEKKTETGEVLEPVVVGAISIAENNHMPCKFTEIVISEEEKGKNVFSEAGSDFENFTRDTFHLTWRTLEDHSYTQQKKYNELSFYRIQPFAMISGMESKKVNISIKNFETDKCKLNQKHDPKIIYLDSQKRKLQTEKKDGVVQVEDQLNINYDYGILEKVFSPWNYFFPFNKPQQHYLKIDSCRHSINLPINVYPDVQWVFTLKFELGKGRKADAFKDLFKADVEPRSVAGNIKNSFEIGLGISWNDKKNYSGIKINPLNLKKTLEDPGGLTGILGGFIKNQMYLKCVSLFDKLQDVMGLLEMFKNAVDIVTEISADIDNIKKGNYKINTDRKLVQFDITFPKLDLSLAWRAGVYDGRSGFVIEGNIKGTFIGLSATFDMFALGGKIPQLRVPIAVLDLVEWASAGRFKFEFNLIISGVIEASGKMAYDQSQEKFTTNMQATGSLDFKLSMKGKVKPDINNKLETREYGVDAGTGFELLYKLEVDDGLWGHSEFNLKALEGSIYTKIVKSRRIEGEISKTSDGIKNEDKDVLGQFTFWKKIPLSKSEKSRWI